MKRLLSFFIPGGIIFLASLVIVHFDAVAASLPSIVSVYPYVVFIAAVFFGWRFNRSSLVFAVFVLALADRSLMYFVHDGTLSGRLVFDAVSFLLPVNLAGLCLAKERGVLTVHGIIRTVLIALQILLMIVFLGFWPDHLRLFFEQGLIDWPLLSRLGLSQSAVLSFGAALLVVGIRFFWNMKARENGFFWALIMSWVALTAAMPGALSVFYFSTAGFILLISIIESSYTMAFGDELTGLPARRALKEDLLKLGSHYTLAMLDIDHFKKFNDRHGHDIGDQVLRMVAAKLSRISGGGRAYRYGGEEFTVIFPGKYAEDAAQHLEGLREEVESSGFSIRGPQRPNKKPRKPKKGSKPPDRVSVTVSIGMAGRDEKNTKPHEVLKAADKALYRAKKEGRNRLCS